jgi:transposase InsO family protein
VLLGLPADFPPLKTLDTHRHNLPLQPTPLLGRAEQVVGAAPEVAGLLSASPGLTVLATSRVPLHLPDPGHLPAAAGLAPSAVGHSRASTQSWQPRAPGAGAGLVARLMRRAGIMGCHRRHLRIRTTQRDPAAHPAPALVQRVFTADAPNELWVSAITYVPSRQGFLFLAVILGRLQSPGGGLVDPLASASRAVLAATSDGRVEPPSLRRAHSPLGSWLPVSVRGL